ncbi:biopolymer transporter ExbD [Sphingomonas koreensis]|jgi:biopolymer transport protein ExbD|uniref:Biopolymer transporter ExbD n=1 Tax=Sphingomonas koreensis TaxID=93064 RepID=A0A1L6J8P4_9SPHN|nr:biopolymer transporter ExbD [Sphingomonas koreensis]APR52303.1 biopolymer transporter ExbD [Sphingomonas koreensis]MDC7811445.1 biopolymer transporter ExbD [Sphingomonas koreensis]PJI88245.1 outer membrane transport energization protein ExbD [Sphingomonas koreensis]RSU19804.1 biopolymer transporter ExbD [Sphingomonas koreensis]RSU26592.1 biopolymer transporter ExbD [Sphingomonas koreensis]
MAMSVGGDSAEEKPMSDINTTPLVDVMLVLLIIFLIAIPVAIQSVELELPKVQFQPNETKPENVLLAVRGEGTKCEVFWNMAPINSADLLKKSSDKLKAVVDRLGDNITPEDIPEVHIRGDVNAPYRCIGGVIYTMQSAGFVKVGFISQPTPGVAAQ